jgi:uncharacterized protein (DUF2384 family)
VINFWYEPTKKAWSVNIWKRLVILQNEYHSYQWLSYPLSMLYRSNIDVIIIEEHLKLVEGCTLFV